MSKKRPRAGPPISGRFGAEACKQEPRYWLGRLFRCRYTYKGKPFEVSHWSVKIQYLGRRKTFALRSSRRSQAAAEACELYRALVTQGWEQATGTGRSGSTPARPSAGVSGVPGDKKCEAEHWAQRLIRRDYPMSPLAAGGQELSVRVEHGGSSYYFPLGTPKRWMAARRASRLYQTIINQGWEAANKRFSRELTVAFHWLDAPLAWTYTTIHTQTTVTTPSVETFKGPSGIFTVGIAESDDGIRGALEWCINQMEGFRCGATYTSTEAVLRDLRGKPDRLLLISNSLAGQSGKVCLEQMKIAAPEVTGLLYSVYEDSEELFRTTPGGAGTYLLRRTPATRVLEPLNGLLEKGPFSKADMMAVVWQYFKDSLAALPSGGEGRPPANLTPREHEVLALLTKGHPDKDIADQLSISIHTVHEHVRNIFEKLGVHNRTEAAVKFLQK